MKYPDARKTFVMTPEQARRQLYTLGYEKLSNDPLGQSDYLTALFIIAHSANPLDFVKVREVSRMSMEGRSVGK